MVRAFYGLVAFGSKGYFARESVDWFHSSITVSLDFDRRSKLLLEMDADKNNCVRYEAIFVAVFFIRAIFM